MNECVKIYFHTFYIVSGKGNVATDDTPKPSFFQLYTPILTSYHECIFLFFLVFVCLHVSVFIGDGRLTIREIVDNAHILHEHSLHGDELMNAFKVFDKNGDGHIGLV